MLTLLSLLGASWAASPADVAGSARIDAEAREVFSTLDAAYRTPQLRSAPPPPSGTGSNLLDVYRYGDLALTVDANGEWLAEATTHIVTGDLNWVMDSISGAFYKHYDDDYQYLCVLIVHDVGFFGAFYAPLANDVRGIGYDAIVRNEVFDQSNNNLDGYIFMNAAELWSENPAEGRFVFGQEFMHRWGAFVNVEQEGLDPMILLGRDNAHWSYWFDTTNSPMEGNDWIDNGDGTFTTDYHGVSTYSDLDLYLMGFVGPEDVPTQTVLLVDDKEAARVHRTAASAPEAFADLYNGSGGAVTVTATAATFGLDAIIAAEGARDPSVETSPKAFKMAFVALVLANDEIDEPTLAMVDGVRKQFEADWEKDVRGLADLDTTLGDGDAPTWGDTGDTGDTGAVVDSGEPDTSTPKEEPSGCGCASSPDAASLLPALLAVLPIGALLPLRRRRVTA